MKEKQAGSMTLEERIHQGLHCRCSVNKISRVRTPQLTQVTRRQIKDASVVTGPEPVELNVERVKRMMDIVGRFHRPGLGPIDSRVLMESSCPRQSFQL